MSSEYQQQLENRIETLESRIEALEEEHGTHEDETTPTIAERVNVVLEADEFASEQRSVRKAVLDAIKNFESAYGKAAPIDHVHGSLRDEYDGEAVLDAIDDLRSKGDIYEPKADHLKVV